MTPETDKNLTALEKSVATDRFLEYDLKHRKFTVTQRQLTWRYDLTLQEARQVERTTLRKLAAILHQIKK